MVSAQRECVSLQQEETNAKARSQRKNRKLSISGSVCVYQLMEAAGGGDQGGSALLCLCDMEVVNLFT